MRKTNLVPKTIKARKVFLLMRLMLICATSTLIACANTQLDDAEAINGKLAGNTMFTPQSWATNANEIQVKRAQEIDWLHSFQDKLLTDLVKLAIANNRDLMAASANVDRAKALAVQAGAKLKPNTNLAFANSRAGSANTSSTDVSNQTLSAQINWEVDLWGRISAGNRAAVASAQAAETDYQFAQYSLAAATSKAYFISIEANKQVAILKDILKSLEETFRIVNVQYENGLASAQDVALTTSDLASTREQLITLESSRREALRALEVLLGQYPKAEVSVSNELPTLPALPPLGVPSDILERRPDIISSERRVAAAYNSVTQAKAARLPQLNLTSNIGGTSTSLTDILNPANVTWQLASNLLAPLYDGGTRKAQVAIATAEQKQAIASYAQAALTAFSEVENNLDLGSTLILREKELHIALTEAERAYYIAQVRHKEGEIALVDLLAMQQRVFSAASNKLSVQRLALEQRINLFLALGGNWNINE
jgi:NodT family efflux transporter outer membrane factor (OMF) lipoprotein